MNHFARINADKPPATAEASAPNRDALVYLDFDNLISNDAPDSGGQWLARLIAHCQAKFRTLTIAAYGDWQKMAAWHKTLEALGVDCIHVSSNTRGGKNSADLEATVDIVEHVSPYKNAYYKYCSTNASL